MRCRYCGKQTTSACQRAHDANRCTNNMNSQSQSMHIKFNYDNAFVHCRDGTTTAMERPINISRSRWMAFWRICQFTGLQNSHIQTLERWYSNAQHFSH